jgi:Protein of unknown function (DUF2865)
VGTRGQALTWRLPACAIALAAAIAGRAAAQSENLFGTPPPWQAQRTEPQPVRTHSYSPAAHDPRDPMAFFNSQPKAAGPDRPASPPVAHAGGGGGAYCVRLCDGRYFPLQRHGDSSPAELCHAFCPASKTKVFFGGAEIDGARAADGARYTSLPNAFLYRERLISDCTCNGKTPYGLATLDVKTDNTLRPGDIVATREGLKAFAGSRWRRGVQTADFTPLNKAQLARERLGRVAVTSSE